MRCQASFFYCCNRHECRRAQLLQYLGEEPLTHAAFEQMCCSQQLPARGTPGFCCLEPDGRPRCGRCDNCEVAAVQSCKVQLENVGEELRQLLQHLVNGGRKGRCALVTTLRRTCPRMSNEDWHRILDFALHKDLVQLDILQGRDERMAFASPQLTPKGQQCVLGPKFDAFVDLGRKLRRPCNFEPPQTLDSVLEPTVADVSDDDLPLLEAVLDEDERPLVQAERVEGVGEAVDIDEEDMPLIQASGGHCKSEEDIPLAQAFSAEKRKGGLWCQATPQRRPRLLGMLGQRAEQSAPPVKKQLLEEVNALKALLDKSQLSQVRSLDALLRSLRDVRAALQAAAISPPATCEVVSPDEIGVQSPKAPLRITERLKVRKPKAKAEKRLQRPVAKAARGKAAACPKFSDREREDSSALMTKLMDAADFNSNQQGGTEHFKRLVGEAKKLAPAEKRPLLEEVLQKHFLAKTPGRHRERLRKIILEWKAEGL